MKVIIFDSGTLITLAMNGLLDLLVSLKKKFSGKFIITEQVKFETIDRPINNKKYELGALEVSELLQNKTLEMPPSLGIDNEKIRGKTKELLNKINHIFIARNEFMHVMDSGETSCLALSSMLNEKGIENMIAVDERTTRMLGEKPENLKKLFENKLHTNIKMQPENLPKLEVKFIRSSELVYIAWKKGLVSLKGEKALDALLYATKFKGSAISREEIEDIERL